MQTSSKLKIVAIGHADALMPAALVLRHEVFVVEQRIPQELEVDDDDGIATHLVALLDSRVVGTLRIVRHGRTAKIGRMAVSAAMRKNGIGRALMEFAAETASSGGSEEIALGAQLTAREFYKRLGYVEEGPVFDDAGLPHVMMRKNLPTETRVSGKERGAVPEITDGDYQQLRELEESLWRAERRFDRDYMDATLAPDFFEFGRSGRVYDRSDSLDVESGAIHATLPLPQFAARLIARDVVLVTYVSEVTYGGALERANRSSLWSRHASGWRLRFHQGTPA